MKGAKEVNPIANFWKEKKKGYTFFAFSFNNFIVININR